MPTEKYTFRKDIRAGGNGSPVAHKPNPSLTDLVSGEFMAWDTTNKWAVRYVRDGSAGNFIGISRDSQKGLAKLGNQTPLADATGATGLFSIFTSGVHLLLGTAAETYKHGDKVYMSGTDTQKITTVAGGGKVIGIVHLPDGTTRSGAVDVPVLIDGQVFYVGGPESDV